ncbi:hypothetical protein Tco_0401389 [Tanacetum coccineum]
MKKLLLFCFRFRVTNEANHDAKSRYYVYESDITTGRGVESKKWTTCQSRDHKQPSFAWIYGTTSGADALSQKWMHCVYCINMGIVLGMLGDFIDYEECYSSAWFYAASLMVYSRIIHVMVEMMSRLFSPSEVKAYKEIACLMLVSMIPDIQKNMEHFDIYDMLQELKTMFSQQAEPKLLGTMKSFHACRSI